MEEKLINMKKIFIIVLIVILLVMTSFFLYKKESNIDNYNSDIKNNDETILEANAFNVDELDVVDGYYYICVKQESNYFGLKENATREEKEKIYNFHQDEKMMLYELCMKEVDLSLIPCDKNLKSLGYGIGRISGFDYDYDSIERIDNEEPNNGNSFIIVKTIKGNIEKVYRLAYGWSDGTFNSIQVKLEEEKDTKSSIVLNNDMIFFDSEHIKSNFEELCLDGDKRIVYPQEEWDGTFHGDNIAVSNNFREKYPYFLDIFIHYSPLEYNKIILKDLEIDNQIATFEVDSILECKRRTYDVKYMLDNKMYLDEIEVNLLREEIVDMSKAEKQSAYYIFQNSDWSKLPISNNFKEKFSSEKGVFFPLEIKQYNIDYIKKDNEYIYIYEFILQNNVKVFYSSVEVFNNKKLIDDVINEMLPYDSSMTLAEVRDAYIRDYVGKK